MRSAEKLKTKATATSSGNSSGTGVKATIKASTISMTTGEKLRIMMVTIDETRKTMAAKTIMIDGTPRTMVGKTTIGEALRTMGQASKTSTQVIIKATTAQASKTITRRETIHRTITADNQVIMIIIVANRIKATIRLAGPTKRRIQK